MRKAIEKMYYLFYAKTKHELKHFMALISVAAAPTLLIVQFNGALFLFDTKEFISRDSNKYIIAGIFIIWTIILYLYFNHDNRKEKIVEKYKELTKKELDRIMLWAIALYVGIILIGVVLNIIERNYY